MITKALAIVFAIGLIAGVEHYAGSYNFTLDLVELLACLILLFSVRKTPRALLAKLGIANNNRRSSSKKFVAGVLCYLLLVWIVFSLSDFLIFSRSIPLEHSAPRQFRNFAVAVSGGGYRAAIYHAGVLEELENISLAPAFISSVSGGSIIGAFYSQGGKPHEFVDAVVAGKFNLERRLLRIDNVLRLFGSSVSSWLSTGVSSALPRSFTITDVQAQLFDDLFLHGLLAKDSVKHAVAEQMICVTDIVNSEIVGITSRGAVIRSVESGKSRYGTGSLPFRCERRRRHNMPNGSSLATKQSATRKLTWMLATIPISGASI
jgi:hypothetical protein